MEHHEFTEKLGGTNPSNFLHKYYKQLIGCKIVDFKFEEDEYALASFPVFILELGGHRIKLSLSMDSEGNGGGFGFIEKEDESWVAEEAL